MIKSIDHLVILVSDLETTIADYTALGFCVVPGGEHAGGATHNVLVAFADGSYLELIAFRRPTPEHQWWRHTAAGEGLIDFALLPLAIEDDMAAARMRGLELHGPTPGGRLRPDGQRLEWQTGRAATADLPFLCADVTSRELRVPSGAAWQHANGVTGITDLVVAVHDLDTSHARYVALLGDAATPAEPAVVLLPTGARAAALSLGTTRITLAAPGDSTDLLARRLAEHGEGPFAIGLGGLAAETLDLKRTHGARLHIG